MWCLHGSLYYQPKQCMVIREIPQNYHQFVLFDSLKMGSLMSLFFTNIIKSIAAKVQIPMPFVPSTAAVLRQSFPLWAPWHAPQRRSQHVEKHDRRWWRSVPKKESLSDVDPTFVLFGFWLLGLGGWSRRERNKLNIIGVLVGVSWELLNHCHYSFLSFGGMTMSVISIPSHWESPLNSVGCFSYLQPMMVACITLNMHESIRS